MFIDMTLNEFLNETASGAPTPGGGSVCALVGALGAALSSMVGEISRGKIIEDKESLQGKVRICKDLVESLKGEVDRDTEAFEKVMKAFKMPKASDEEKEMRSEAIQEALMDAAEMPYEVALLCIDVMSIAIDMLKVGSKNVASDATVAGFLGYAALNGAVYNVKINLNSIKDKDYTDGMRSKIEELTEEGERLLKTIKSMSEEIIG